MEVVSPATTVGLPPATTLLETMSACAAVGTASTTNIAAVVTAKTRRTDCQILPAELE